MFDVEVPTTMQVLAVSESGQQAQGQFSFDSALERHGALEVHGTEGSIVLPDPNRFVGEIRVVRPPGVLRDGSSFEQMWIDVERQGAEAGRGPRPAGHGALDRRGSSARRHRRARLPRARRAAVGRGASDRVRLRAVESTLSAPVPVLPADFDSFARTI